MRRTSHRPKVISGCEPLFLVAMSIKGLIAITVSAKRAFLEQGYTSG